MALIQNKTTLKPEQSCNVFKKQKMRTAFRAKILRQVFCRIPEVGDSKLEIKYKQDFALKIHMMVASPSTIMELLPGRG